MDEQSSAPGAGWRYPGVVLATGLLWLAGVGVGLGALYRHASTPGPRAETPARWPSSTSLTPAGDAATLVMLAHPRCPCTRASLGELEVLLARAGGSARAYVLFLRPEGVEAGWEQGELWRRAAALPGVTVLRDEAGEEARRFGATTSGHVLLYGPDGRLRFSGGVTGSRGHAGPNAGRDALEALLREGAGAPGHAVYGCSLREPSAVLPEGPG